MKKRAKILKLADGHKIRIEEADRGFKDDYKVTFFEDGKKLFSEYADKECIEYEYGIKL